MRGRNHTSSQQFTCTQVKAGTEVCISASESLQNLSRRPCCPDLAPCGLCLLFPRFKTSVSGRKSQHPFNLRSTQDAKLNTRSALDPPKTQKSTPVQPSIHPGRKSQHPFSPRSTQDAKFDTRSTLRSVLFQYLDHLLLNILHLNHEYKD